MKPELENLWSSIRPEERSILTAANRVNVQNQKFRKELALKQRGIEDEMKCDNILYSKRELLMQNRLNRYSKASDNTYGRFGTPFSSASSDNWLSKQGRPNSNQENRTNTSRSSLDSPSRMKSRNDHILSDKDARSDSTLRPRPSSEQRRYRHVHFGQQSSTPMLDNYIYADTTQLTQKVISPRKFIQSDSILGRGLSSLDVDNDIGSTSTPLPSIPKTGKHLNKVKSSSLVKKSSHGFSNTSVGHGLTNTTPRNSLKALSGLEEEMARWRRLHYTRAVNARIKAVRSGGKRHASCITLRETMNHAALLRKEEALHPEPFTAEKAWGLLNCGYLRLTPNNIATLEEICSSAGYDVSTHPHKSVDVIGKEMNDIFAELRESRRMQPDGTSQLKFRQSLLFKRLSEGLYSSL